jgi:hypothetical protein
MRKIQILILSLFLSLNSFASLNELSEEKQDQESAYREFVGNYYEEDYLDRISYFIIPLMSLLGFGYFGLVNTSIGRTEI